MKGISNRELQPFDADANLRKNDSAAFKNLQEIYSRKNLGLATKSITPNLSPYTATYKDAILFIDASIGDITINLPNSNSWGPKKSPVISLIRVDNSAGVVTITPVAADSINLAAAGVSITLLQGRADFFVQSTGAPTPGYWSLIAALSIPSASIDWANPGTIGSGTPNTIAGTTGNFSSYITLDNNQNTNTFVTVNNANTGSTGQAGFTATSDLANILATTHAVARTVTRYGIALGGYAELRAEVATANGLLIGTGIANKPVVFGSNNLEALRILGQAVTIPGTLGVAGAISSTAANVGPLGGVYVNSAVPSLNLNYTSGAADAKHWSFLAFGANTLFIRAYNDAFSGAVDAMTFTRNGIATVGTQVNGIFGVTGAATFSSTVGTGGTVTATITSGGYHFNAVGTTAAGNVWYKVGNTTQSWLVGVRGDSSDIFSIYDNTGGGNRLTITPAGAVTIPGTLGVTGAATFGATVGLKGYIVGTLPAGTVGDIAYCTDLVAPAFLVAAVGGGTVVGPVFRNATVWVAF